VSYIELQGSPVPIKMWTKGVPVEDAAVTQLRNLAALPFVHSHVAVMPDVHWGAGTTIGTVVPTIKALIPAAVGVDIGCGMMAQQTSLRASDLPDNLHELRTNIERRVPHGRSHEGGPGDCGAWDLPDPMVLQYLKDELTELEALVQLYPELERAARRAPLHAGTLGTGNHFIEVCIDEDQYVWLMLHSGSRGIGNRIGTFFIEKAKREMDIVGKYQLSDKNLAYLSEGSKHFDHYCMAVLWAQAFARKNRELMMMSTVQALVESVSKEFLLMESAVNCHHNYVSIERHFGQDVYLTRKGAVSAQADQLGIIPGSMGAKSYLVRGKGNPDSFCSCSHGAGRVMGRNEAKKRFTVEDHVAATVGVECRKDDSVLDETPMAYKDIDMVMAAQADLVDVVHTLKQVVCVKG